MLMKVQELRPDDVVCVMNTRGAAACRRVAVATLRVTDDLTPETVLTRTDLHCFSPEEDLDLWI